MNATHAIKKEGGVLSVGLPRENIVGGDLNNTGINPALFRLIFRFQPPVHRGCSDIQYAGSFHTVLIRMI